MEANPLNWLDIWDKGGPFVAGIVTGFLLSYLMYKILSNERIKQIEIEGQERAELRKQIEIKEERISKLHDKLEHGHEKIGQLEKELKLALESKKVGKK